MTSHSVSQGTDIKVSISFRNLKLIAVALILANGCGTPNPIGDGTVWGNVDSSEEIVEEEGIANRWSRKDLVKSVQESLQELGYSPGNINGKETNQTLLAVKQYRIDHGLEVNTVIDADLEQHIDDLIWKTRNEESIDPREVAKVIVQNREEEYCSRKLGEDYASNISSQAETVAAHIYIYRIQTSEGARPDYPASKILVNSKYVGTINHNQHIKLSINPGAIVLTEEESTQLGEKKKSKEFKFQAEAGQSYYFQLIVGKYDKVTHSSVSQSAPFHIGGGILDYLIGELVWDIMNSHKYKDTHEVFYYADYIQSKEHIGQCHVSLTESSN